jgi:hypothetical protein
VKHIKLDRHSEQVKRFIRTLDVDANGSILELSGRRLLRVLPVEEEPVDAVRLKAGILRRRKESRRLNAEWQAVDQEAWEAIDSGSE